MHRYLALDIGTKRTGIALVDDLAKVATPLQIISETTNAPEFIKQLNVIIEEWDPFELIVGLPIDLKGKEAIAANDVRARTISIVARVNATRDEPLEVNFVDERMSSAQAERAMKDYGASPEQRSQLRDAAAAAVIAQTFIDTL